MNALLIALTMSLTGAEGNIEGPGIQPELAPFPLHMSLFNVEAPKVDRSDVLPPTFVTLCVAFELPSYAELADVKHLAAPMAFDGTISRPWMAAQPVETEKSLAWMTNWEQR